MVRLFLEAQALAPSLRREMAAGACSVVVEDLLSGRP